jgi:hypothetical protein
MSQTWYKKIDDEIFKRNNSCRLNGLNYIYEVDDPYQYGSYEAFMRAHPYDIKQQCVFKSHKLSQTDTNKRYFKYINNAGQCKEREGVWDPTSINRGNKYSQGTCWVSEQDMTCGKNVLNNYILSKDEVSESLRDDAFETSKRSCAAASDKCTWVKNKHRNDCVAKKKAESVIQTGKPVEFPPDTMPIDITDPSKDIQSYIGEWYRSGTAPKTASLEKKVGDQCNPASAIPQGSSSDVWDLDRQYTIKELKKIPFPLSRINRAVLKKALGSYKVSILDKSENPHERPRNPAVIDDIDVWNSKELYRTEDDIPYEDMKVVQKSTMTQSISQSVINMVMKRLAKEPTATARGILGWHSVGSGKTSTAAGVMDAMWDSGRPIIFVSSIDAIAANPPSTFHMGLKNLFPRFEKYSVPQIGNMFEQRGIEFLSFAKAANRLRKTQKVFNALKIDPKRTNINPKRPFVAHPVAYIRDVYGVKDEVRIRKALKEARISNWKDFFDMGNSVLIIDEVHNLFRPLANQKNDHNYLEGHLIGNNHPNMKVVILTATPGDNVRDVMKLVNIVRNPTKPVITAPDPENPESVANFKQQLAGLISYLDTSTDVGKFPRLIDNGPTKFPMHDKQFMKYVEAYKEAQKKKTVTNYDALAKSNQLAKWWAPARKYSNMLYSFETGLEVSEISSKLPALLDRIAANPLEKQYVYSAFYEDRGTSQGVHEIARQLQAQGYKKYDYKEAIKVVKAYKPNVDKPPNGPLSSFMAAEKRFMLVTQKELGDGPKVGQNLAKLLTIFNSPDNKDGKFIQIMVASQGFNEGLDLKAVRHIHIFEPLVTMASDIQTIGRARRFCSHKDLNYEDWTVKVHRYMSDFPLDVDVENTDNMTGHLDSLNGKITEMEALIKIESNKAIKATLRNDIKNFKTELVVLKRDIRSKGKLNTSEIENIDEFVYKESRRRMKELFVVYHAMKEAAIDCILLKDFHADSTLICGVKK